MINIRLREFTKKFVSYYKTLNYSDNTQKFVSYCLLYNHLSINILMKEKAIL